MTFEVRRLIKNGLSGTPNWLEAEILEETRRLELCVTLPSSRKVRSARLVQHKRQTESAVVSRTTMKGKQCLRTAVLKPPVGELYTLEWVW